MAHMSQYKLFSDSQHGFLPHKACTTQLLTAMNHWTESLNSGYATDIISFDFKKAFDSVPHCTPLDNVQDMRDLGVTIDSKLNFHSHSTYTVSKANRLLGLIRKSFENISIQTLPILYKSLVRPTLEYGNPIWDPYYVLDQQAVDRVQRRATRMIQPLRDLPYHTRLHQLNLPSLTYRRRRGDMIIMYQITHHLLNIPFPAFFIPSSYICTRGHNYKLLKSHFRCRPRQLFFSIRSIIF